MITTHNTVTRSTVTRLQGGALLLGLAALTSLVGCPGEEPGSSTTEDMNDMQDTTTMDMTPDMVEDASKDTDMSDMDEVTCTPATECPADVCGMVVDGCGGMLDCGACGCVDGVAASPTCGACGFGTTDCSGVQGSGDGVCSLSELAAIPSNCDAVVYVRETNPPALPDGTRDNPFSSLEDALQAAKDQDAEMIVIAEGNYSLSAGLALEDGMHIVGGFTDDFIFNEDAKSAITIAPTGDDVDQVGVEAYNLQNKTWLKQLSLTIKEVDGGKHLYGIHASNAPGLHLDEVEVYLSALGDGSSGKNGDNGADGESGGNATFYTLLGKREGDTTQDGYTNGAFAGAAGLNTFCRNRAGGGAGGEGGHIIVMENAQGNVGQVTPIYPESGFSNAAGTLMGGQGGDETMPNGFNGLNGAPGIAGGNGLSGVSSGAIMRTFWKVDSDGVPGEDGEAGTGGSGGGGTWWMTLTAGNYQDGQPGLSGGGGGAGGCGGRGGEAGQAGSTGFAMLIVNSQGVILDNVTLQSVDAGNGGNGGNGGQGGLGATGGIGSQKYATALTSSGNYVGEANHPHNAGSGGSGAPGGGGGTGGAGAGGSSFGIYCDNASTVVKMGDTTAVAGAAGEGGQLGSTPAQDGLSQDVVECW